MTKVREIFTKIIVFILMISFAYSLTLSNNFTSGTFSNTIYNGSDIKLSGNNLSGNFTSQVFDAGSTAVWTSFNFSATRPSIDYLYAVDSQANVYSSANDGISWSLRNLSYTSGTPGDTEYMFSDSNGNLYILKNTARQVWKSNNSGVTWSVVNGTFANKDLFVGTADSNNLYVFAGTAGAVYRSMNGGINWSSVTGYDGGTPKGATTNSSGAVFVVDNGGRVYYSTDFGTSWTNVNSGYGRTTDTQDMFADSNGNLYIITSTNKEVWKSNNSGVTWSVVNGTFAGGSALQVGRSDRAGNLFVIAGSGAGIVYKSTNAGVSWTNVNASYNGGNGAARGMANPLYFTNITFQIRNCSISCTNEFFIGPDGTSSSYYYSANNLINLTGRYFQYRTLLTSQDSGITPTLQNASIDYVLLDTTIPSINFVNPSPANGSYQNYNFAVINITSSDANRHYVLSDFNRSLLGWFRFDNLLNDSSNYGNNLTCQGNNCPSYIPNGIFGGAYKFDGNQQFVKLNTIRQLNNRSDFTLAGWVKLRTNPNDLDIFFSKRTNDAGVDSSTGWVFGYSNTQGLVFAAIGGTSVFSNLIFPTDGGWHQVVATFNSSSNATAIYLDGRMNVSGIIGGMVYNQLNITLGNYNNYATSAGLNGSFDEAAIFGRILSQSEISSLYNASANQYSNTFGNLGAGVYSVNAYAVDVAGNTNQTETRFTIDNLAPNLSISSPQNITYSLNSIFLNYSASDASGIGSCKYSIDASVNISLSVCSTATISGLADGSHNLMVYATDNAGNTNSNNVSFSVASIPPQWTGLQTGAPAVYSLNRSYFNVTWTSVNSLGSVLFESNFSGIGRNYTMNDLGNGIYEFNETLPAGTFYWKSYANDSYGNLNSTTQQTFTIAKSDNQVNLYINGNINNISLTYGNSVNASASSGLVTLSRDSFVINNPDIAVLAAGYYFYNASVESNQNYSASSVILSVNVTKANPVLSLLLNNLPADLEISYGNASNANGTSWNGGDSDIQYTLLRDGMQVSNPDNSVLGAGSYNYTYSSSAGQNYSSGMVSRILTIGKASPQMHLYLNGGEGDLNIIYGTVVNMSAYLNNGLNLSIYRNGNLIGQGIGSIEENLILAAGYYNYTARFEGDDNHSALGMSRFVNVSKANPVLSLLLNGVDSDSSINVLNEATINGSVNIPIDGNINLYEDGSLIGQGNKFEVMKNYSTVGVRTWKVKIDETENYSAGEKIHTFTVNDINSPQFSNIKTSQNNPVAYSPGKSHGFNISWTHNLGIAEVIFQFNGTNYSSSSGQVQKNGNEYFVNMVDLPSGSYQYVWYANSTSGNNALTQTQSYVVDKAITALFLTMTPSNNILYGVGMSISCSANNPESNPSITRGAIGTNNPDNSVLGAGSYNYACTSQTTQNYSSASTTAVMTITKANPALELKLNNESRDLILPVEGGLVNISGQFLGLGNIEINVSVDGNLIGSGAGIFENQTLFTSTGVHQISILSSENGNYSMGSLTRTVTVSSPSQPSNGGGSSGGGSSGGSSSTGSTTQTNSSAVFTGTSGLDIKNLKDIVADAGESKKLIIDVKNLGSSYLNGCKIKGIGAFGEWIKSEETKKLGAGEASEFNADLNAPTNISAGSYSVSFVVSCDELEKSASINVEILEKKLSFSLINAERKNSGNLSVTYELKELSGRNQNVEVQFLLFNADNQKILEYDLNESLMANETKKGSVDIPINNNLQGDFNLIVNINSEKYSTFVQENLVLGKDISGLSIFNSGSYSDRIFAPGLLLLFAGFAGFMVYRIVKLRGEAKEHRKLRKAVKVKTVGIGSPALDNKGCEFNGRIIPTDNFIGNKPDNHLHRFCNLNDHKNVQNNMGADKSKF